MVMAGIVGVVAGATVSACMVDREGAPCDRDDNCPRSQYCDLTNKCVELKPTLQVDVACQLILVSLTQKFSECVGGRADHWYQGIDVPSVCRTLTASVTANRLTYSPMQLKVCRAALLGDTCSDLIPRNAGQMLAECPAFTGTVATSGACTTDQDCGADGWCDTTSGCPGTCKTYVSETGPCTATQLCQLGLGCHMGACLPYVTSGSCDVGPCQPYSNICRGSQCVSRSPEGTPGCFYYGADFFCRLDTKCVGGLFATRVCQKGLPLGAACAQATNACDYFTSCQPGDGGTFCQRDPGPGGNCGIVNNDIIGCTSSRCSGLLGGVCLQYVPVGGTCANGSGDCGPLARCVNGICRAEFCQ